MPFVNNNLHYVRFKPPNTLLENFSYVFMMKKCCILITIVFAQKSFNLRYFKKFPNIGRAQIRGLL